MSGRLFVIGLGPGDARYLTQDAVEALQAADALYGYGPYLDRVPVRDGQSRHPSDNREESERARAGAGGSDAARFGQSRGGRARRGRASPGLAGRLGRPVSYTHLTLPTTPYV